MLASLLMLAMLGQTPADKVGIESDGHLYFARDDAGTRWHHADAAYLRSYVASRNLSIAPPKPDAKVPPEPPKDGEAIPPAAVTASPPSQNFGIDVRKLYHGPSVEWYGGNVPQSYGAAGDAARRIHLTVIGPEAKATVERWRASPSFKAIEDAMGDRLAVQAIRDPRNPLVAAVGLPAGGRPDVVIQAADGKVLDRWKDDPGSEVVAGELRRLDPNYRPELDPKGGFHMGLPDLGLVDLASSIVAGVVVLCLILIVREAVRRA